MIAQEIKESLKTLTPAELLELKQAVDEICAATPKKSASFEEAAEHVRTDYAHLLHKLSQ